MKHARALRLPGAAEATRWYRRRVRGGFRVGLAMLVAGLCAGLQWEATQVFAGLTMFAKNVEEMSYSEAAMRNFDSGALCGICVFVASAKQDSPEDPALAPVAKEKPPLLFARVEPVVRDSSGRSVPWLPERARRWAEWKQAVPEPPPKDGIA